MRKSLSGMTLLFLLAGGTFLLQAQTNAPPNPQLAREYRMISFLTLAQQEQYAKARAKALADNPGLEADGEKVMKQGEALTADSPKAEKLTFLQKMNAHRQKLRQAMLKEDPTLGPIFAAIDKHISEMRANQLSQGQSSPGATDAQPAGPASH